MVETSGPFIGGSISERIPGTFGTEKSRDTPRSHFNWYMAYMGLSQSGILSCPLPCGRGSNLIANKLLYHDYARFSRIDLSPNNSVPRARLPIKVETVVRNTHILVYKLYPLSYRFYTCTCIYTRVAYDLLVKQFPLRHM